MKTDLYIINPQTFVSTFFRSGNRAEMGSLMDYKSNNPNTKEEKMAKWAMYDGTSGKLISSTYGGGTSPNKGNSKMGMELIKTN